MSKWSDRAEAIRDECGEYQAVQDMIELAVEGEEEELVKHYDMPALEEACAALRKCAGVHCPLHPGAEWGLLILRHAMDELLSRDEEDAYNESNQDVRA